MSHSSSSSVSTSSGGISSSRTPPRKRKLSPSKNGLSKQKKQKFANQSNQSSIQEHFTAVEVDMAHQVTPPMRSLSAPAAGDTNTGHKLYLNNHSKGGASNNHNRKPGQGKKLVIKNLKGILLCTNNMCMKYNHYVLCI